MANPLPRPLAAVRNAQLPDGRIVDVAFASGVVSAITTAGTVDPVGPVLDLRGRLLLPAPAEPHAHLDKARSFDAANPKLGDLGSAIDAWRSHASAMSVESIVERARAQALAMLAAGTTAIRSHVDVLGDGGAGLEDVTLVGICVV